jgi:hypothetical protein
MQDRQEKQKWRKMEALIQINSKKTRLCT